MSTKAKDALVTVRHMRFEDLPAIEECEQLTHRYVDEDFEAYQLPDYCWNASDFSDAIRQYKSSVKGTSESRGQVACVGKSVWGAFVYLLRDDHYEIVLFTSHPEAPEATRDRMLSFMIEKASSSERRRKIVFNVPDGNYKTLKFFVDRKFTMKKGEKGTWKCEFELKMPKELQVAGKTKGEIHDS